MAGSGTIKMYSPAEERINVGSHALGLLLSAVGLPMLIWQAARYGGVEPVIAATVFGLSLLILYSASTVYHREERPLVRVRLRILDHSAIFILIAGTYTPFTLLVLDGTTGWLVFAAVWGLALTGVVLKIFYTGHYKHASTAMYLLMGWMMVFAIEPLVANLSSAGLTWLIAGGLAYTVGALLYGIQTLPFNHAVFHLFVLAGSFCHFVAVYRYVLPAA